MAAKRGKRVKVELLVWRDHWSGYDAVGVEPKDIEPGCYLASVGFSLGGRKGETLSAREIALSERDSRVKHVTAVIAREIIYRKSWTVTLPKEPS